MKAGRKNWKAHLSDLEYLTDELIHGTIRTRKQLIPRLEVILGRKSSIQGVDTRILALLEFCFFMAGGPYGPLFDKYCRLIKRILTWDNNLKRLLNYSADHAIANMVLHARGRLKFKVSDVYELNRVLDAWQYMGLERQTHRSVLHAISQKKAFKHRLQENNPYLLARLAKIFPNKIDEFIPPGMDLRQAIYEHQNARFGPLVDSLLSQGITLDELIVKENQRPLLVIQRNPLLAYLVKRRHEFSCQVCNHFPIRSTKYLSRVEAHHIVPLSQGGEDQSSNLLVLCPQHHLEVHQAHIETYLTDNDEHSEVEVRCEQGMCTLRSN